LTPITETLLGTTVSGLTGRPMPSWLSSSGGTAAWSVTNPVSISGATAFVTAAWDSPVRRAISTRGIGPWVRILVSTSTPAGVTRGSGR
jgi:hypothetical protein